MVWIDIFAVRQWPGNGADLDFTGVVEQCRAFVLSATSLPGVRALKERWRWRGGSNEQYWPPPALGDQKVLAFCRVWCLVEIGAALKHGKPVVMRCGRHCLQGNLVFFENDTEMLEKMYHLVNVMEAQATVPADRERILREVQEAEGGAAALDSLIKGAIVGAKAMAELQMPAVEAAACGEPEWLARLGTDAMSSVLKASCAVGIENIFQVAIDAGVELDESEAVEAFTLAAKGGHLALMDRLADTCTALGAVQCLNLSECKGLVTLNAGFLCCVSTLTELSLEKCDSLVALPEGV